MNPHDNLPVTPAAMARGLWRNRDLIRQMTWREVLGRYRGSLFGLAWSFFNPVLMLVVYTFVFSGVFKARWMVEGDVQASHGGGKDSSGPTRRRTSQAGVSKAILATRARLYSTLPIRRTTSVMRRASASQ